MRIQINKKIFSNTSIIPVCEIICCILFILSFIYIGMNSSFFHQLLFDFFNPGNHSPFLYFIPIGSEFFLLTLFFVGIIIILAWMNRVQGLNFFIPLTAVSKRRFILILLTAAICLSTIPLFISWSTANPYPSTIGGLLPYADADGYYNGAEHFLETGKLDTLNQRRPLNTILFSERLFITNFDFRSALLLQSIMFGFAAFFAALAVARSLGKLAGIMMFAGLFALAVPYLPMPLTEVLGITLGALGFTLLWMGVSDKKQLLFFSGLILLTLALFARAGAMFVLPVLVIYSGYFFRGDKPYNFKIAAIAVMCIVSGFFINQSLIWLYGDGTGSALNNFSCVLYGLAEGGKGWTQAYIDFPQLASMTEAQQSTFLYKASLDLISNNPLLFIKTITNNLVRDSFNYIYTIIGYIGFIWMDYKLYPQFSNPSSLIKIIVGLPVSIILLIAIIRSYIYQKNRDLIIFLFVIIAAIFLSLPFFYSDVGIRGTAATFPFIAATISIIIVGLLPKSYIQKKKTLLETTQPDISIYPLLMSIFIISSVLIFPIIGPNIAKSVLNPPSHSSVTHTGMDNQSEFIMRFDPGMPYLHFESNKERGPTFAPNVHSEDFRYIIFFENQDVDPYFKSPIQQNSSLVLGYDIVSHSTQFVQIPEEFTIKNRQYLKIIAQPYRNNSFVYIVKNESDIQHLE